MSTAMSIADPTKKLETTVSTAMSIADPTCLRRELDERMKKLESEGDDYYWLDQKKYPAAIGLMVDYICSLFEHRKSTNTATPQPETVTKQEAIEKYHTFPPPVTCSSRLAWT